MDEVPVRDVAEEAKDAPDEPEEQKSDPAEQKIETVTSQEAGRALNAVHNRPKSDADQPGMKAKITDYFGRSKRKAADATASRQLQDGAIPSKSDPDATW